MIELKRTHIRIPRSLWDRLKRHFPEYGDVQRVFTQALTEYLARYEEAQWHKSYAQSMCEEPKRES